MNKFMKKIMSKKDGFTLVELIVVIAILAILAGVAIPVYSGYITKANDAADITVLDAIATAAQAAKATSATGVQKIEVYVDSDGDISLIEVDDDTYYDAEATDKWPVSDFALYMNDVVGTLKGSYAEDPDGNTNTLVAGATWTPADGWETGAAYVAP